MFELPQHADHGEAILAFVGLRPFLLRDTGRIYAETWRDIGRVEKYVEERAKELVAGETKIASGPALEYDKMLDNFAEPIPMETFDAVTNEFPPSMHDSTTAFVATVARAWNYLKSKFPVSAETTLTGVHQLPPSDYALGAFEDLLEIVDKPFSVFEMVASGRLTTAQATALETVYPGLYRGIIGAIVIAIVEERAKDKEYEPEWGRGLSVLMAVPGMDPALTAMLGTPGPTSTQQQKPAPSDKQGAEKDATRLANASQKIEQQQAG